MRSVRACAIGGERRREIRRRTHGNCDTGLARKPHCVGRRRSQTLSSNTCQQRTCLNRLYKYAHESYEFDRHSSSLSRGWTNLSAVCKMRSLLCDLLGIQDSVGVESRASCEGPRMRVLSESVKPSSKKAHLIALQS